MLRSLATVALALSLLAAGVALASDESEQLTARGVVELHQGVNAETANTPAYAAERYAEALALFTKAVEADPADVYALYFKGVTEGRLEQWDAAVTDLRSVLATKSELVRARLDLGIVLVKSGQDDAAIESLTAAQQVPDLDAAASLYLGIAYLHRQNLPAARQSFERAAVADPQLTAVYRYYKGIVELQAGNRGQATELFKSVVAETQPPLAIRREAQDFLVGLQQGEWPTLRPYHLYASTGLEYDSNVQLAPLSETLASAFGKQSDGRAVILAGGNYTLWQSEHAQLGAAYDFFQSLHFDLTQFNIQQHRASVFLTGSRGIVSGGVLGAYDYYLRDTSSFMQEGDAFSWVSVDAAEWGRSQVFYRLQRRDFKEISLQNALDSLGHTLGFDQYVYLQSPDRYVVAGYRYDLLDPADGAEKVFMYHANQGRTGIGWMWPRAIATQLDFAYRAKDYNAASGGRMDDEYRLICSAEKPVAAYTTVGLAYFGTFNRSNQSVFEYNRHIVSLSVQVRF